MPQEIQAKIKQLEELLFQVVQPGQSFQFTQELEPRIKSPAAKKQISVITVSRPALIVTVTTKGFINPQPAGLSIVGDNGGEPEAPG